MQPAATAARPMPASRRRRSSWRRCGRAIWWRMLYTSGTTGPSKGVCCPHAQYFWWGVNTAHLLGDARRRRAVHHAAAVPHQCAEHILSGAADRRPRNVRVPVLGLRLSSDARLTQGNRHLSARRHGADSAVAGADAPKSAPPRAHCARARRAGALPSRNSPTRTDIRLLDGWGSTETNFVLGTTIDRAEARH